MVEVFPNAGPQSSVAALSDTIRVSSVATGTLLVDADRDGMMRLDGTDTTSATNPYRFWINDDDDWEDTLGNDIPGQFESVSGSFLGHEADFSTLGTGTGNVNGTRDLVDYFPLYLNIKEMLRALPPSDTIRYKIKQADSALNFVYTNLTRDRAASFQTIPMNTGFGPELTETAGVARKWHITTAGVDLFDPSRDTSSSAFLNAILNQDGGVILVEGRASTTEPLVLSIEKSDGTALAEVKLEIKIVAVETMFHYVNLRSFASGEAVKPDHRGPAFDQPGVATDAPNDPFGGSTNRKNLVLVHGYNWNGDQARGFGAEMFKRFYWSGSKARVFVVLWRGDDSQKYIGKTIGGHGLTLDRCA